MIARLKPAHLTEAAAGFLERPVEDRVYEARRDHWVGYPRAKEGLQRMEDLLTHPRTARMPNILISGPSGIGKTTIVNRFLSLHPVRADNDGNAIVSTLAINMTTVPNESRFWSEMLRALDVCYREGDSPQRKKNQAHELLAFLNCRMLIIDEIHNLLTGGPREQRIFLALLKNLSNELGMPMVCVGTADAVRALSTDTQVSSRFVSFGLRRMKLDANFQGFLKAYERHLPLSEPSGLASPEMTQAIHRASDNGLIGEVSKILKEAAVEAIRTGRERITVESLEAVDHVRLSQHDRYVDD